MRALVQDYLVINSVGLGLDFVGAALILAFGLPNARALDALLHKGHDVRVTGSSKEDQARAWRVVRRHQRWGRTGIGLLMLGIVLQLLSNAMQRHWLALPWW